MNHRQSIATAIKTIRKIKGLTQDDFGVVSSRTYLSSLERGLKSPTFDKLDDIAKVLDTHPAVIVLFAYALQQQPIEREAMIDEVSEVTRRLCASCC